MRQIDPSKLSKTYAVRALGPDDADLILALCAGNPQFYRYSPAECTREQVLSDMTLTPPNTPPERKHYVGFFEGDALVAVMDVVEGYPAQDVAYIGFFMVDAERQGKGVGRAIIREALSHLQSLGYTAARLAIDEGNPQSTAFWTRNGFAILGRAPRGDDTALVAERKLD